jgi:hypothetical protein
MNIKPETRNIVHFQSGSPWVIAWFMCTVTERVTEWTTRSLVSMAVNYWGCICSRLVCIVAIRVVLIVLYVCIVVVLVVLCGYCCTCPRCVLLYLLYCVCIAGVTLDAELLARSQYSEGPATGHLDTRFSWFPCVYKQMLRWLLCFQVATTCFSRSPPNLKLNVSVTSFIFLLHLKWPLPPGDSPIAVYYYYCCYYYYYY